jgi:hypothetical protein
MRIRQDRQVGCEDHSGSGLIRKGLSGNYAGLLTAEHGVTESCVRAAARRLFDLDGLPVGLNSISQPPISKPQCTGSKDGRRLVAVRNTRFYPMSG